MRTTNFKIGQRFQLTETGRIYQITRISEKSIWFKDETRSPIWRNSINVFTKLIERQCNLIN